MEYRKIPINEINLDLENPRIKQWLEIYSGEITSEGIALALSASSGNSSNSSYSALKESIKVNKGLINPIIVNKDSTGALTVIEGNTRLQIYKEFAVADPNGPWNEIIAIVYDDLPIEQIHAIRLQTHLVGPRDWDPFSKAKYLNQLSNVDKMPMSMIISFCGGKTAEINKLIDAYNDMVSNYIPLVSEKGMDPDPREFSKFAELQNRSIKDALAVHKYTKKDFAQWVIDGHIDNAQNVRQLPKILANRHAKEIFFKSTITEAVKGLDSTVKTGLGLRSATIDDLTVALTQKIVNIEWKDVRDLRDNPDNEEQKNNLLTLRDELNSLLDEIEG